MLVVIAEKDPHELEALRAGMLTVDCDVLAAFDGAVALSLIRQHSPDAVVLTSSLGQMGGLAVSREIKTSADLGEIRAPKTIVLFEREADAWLSTWSRCDAWMVKPVDPVDVADLVKELVTPTAAKA